MPDSPEVAASNETHATADPAFPDKVVVQFGGSVVKGYTHRSAWSPEALALADHQSPLIQPVGEQAPITVDLRSAKAAFFVRSFEGLGHNPILYHDKTPHKDALWVRVIFQDGERVEAILENSREFLLYDTLALAPFDPEGNNHLIICAKTQIREFHVLGVRSL